MAQGKQGNSVIQDLPQTRSEANTTISVLYILDIDSHCPYLLTEAIWGNHLPVNFMLKFPISTILKKHLPFNQWRGTFKYFQKKY